MRHPTLMAILIPRVEVTFHRSGQRPLFVGEVSNDIGYNLEYTREAIDVLVESGVLRAATPREIDERLGSPGSNVFVMASSANLGKAYAP
jgi:hypothetical protein